MSYDGQERRRMNQFDQEIYQKIIETHTNVNNLVKNFESHVETDDNRFTEMKGTIEFHKKIIYGCLGVVFTLEFLSKFLN